DVYLGMNISILESFRCIEVYRVKRGMVAYEKKIFTNDYRFFISRDYELSIRKSDAEKIIVE
ncbi:hypothetical protein ACTPEM_24785, partial [Clostridioides difficile]